jgi:hypothetical protein
MDGITYEGSESEIRRIVENPPSRRGWKEYPQNPCPPSWPPNWSGNEGCPIQRTWDGSPRVTCNENE